MGTTQSKPADNSLRAVVLAAAPTDLAAPTPTELNGGVAFHCQLSSSADWPLEPNTKEYDAGSWCTGGQDVNVRSLAMNFTIGGGGFTLKSMTDDPDTVRAAWSSGPMTVAYAIRDAESEDDPFADGDRVYVVPLNIGLTFDLPQREGVQLYKVEASYAGGGVGGTVTT